MSPKLKVLIYTFYNWNNLTYKIVRNLDIPELELKKYYLGNLKSLCKHIVNYKYDYILGLGDYLKTSRRIRVEKRFINRYGRGEISLEGKEFYESNWDLDMDINKDIKYEICESDKGSRGPCNRSGYKILETFECKGVTSKFAFVHIPGKLEKSEIIKLIKSWLFFT